MPDSITPQKTYTEMTPAERLADRIRRNREMESRIVPKTAATAKTRAPIAERQKAVSGALDKFQQIKKTQGIDAAAEFVRSRRNP